MKFYIKQTGLEEWQIQNGMGGYMAGPFDSLESARSAVDTLSAEWKRNACAWNGHELNGQPTATFDNRFTTDTVCQEHQGFYQKSLNSLAESNPTIRGNEVKNA